MEIVMVLVLVMGLALGWMLGLDSGKKSQKALETEKDLEMLKALDLIEKAVARDLVEWTKMVRELESELRLEKAKAKARELARGQEN